jgi:hypothetical protein
MNAKNSIVTDKVPESGPVCRTRHVVARFEIAVEAFSSEPEAAAYIDAGLRLHLLGLDVPGVNIGNVVTRPIARHDDADMTEALTASVKR